MSEMVLNTMLGIDLSKHRLKLNEVLSLRCFLNSDHFVEINRIVVFFALSQPVLDLCVLFIEAFLVRRGNGHYYRSALFQQFQSLLVVADSLSDSS